MVYEMAKLNGFVTLRHLAVSSCTTSSLSSRQERIRVTHRPPSHLRSRYKRLYCNRVLRGACRPGRDDEQLQVQSAIPFATNWPVRPAEQSGEVGIAVSLRNELFDDARAWYCAERERSPKLLRQAPKRQVYPLGIKSVIARYQKSPKTSSHSWSSSGVSRISRLCLRSASCMPRRRQPQCHLVRYLRRSTCPPRSLRPL